MANNHQGDVYLAETIVDSFCQLAEYHGINAGMKLQFRQLDTFIHPDKKESDLKFVKRFNDTRLSKEQFKRIVEYIRGKGMTTVATAFDNESIHWFEDLDIDVIKVASCSIDDWPLLRELAKINKKIIISTGGATIREVRRVYELFKKNERDFAFMHCVGDYPTLNENANLQRITQLKEEFPDVEVGYSTHEKGDEPYSSLVPYAVAMGASIIEKHVGVTDPRGESAPNSLNAYSVESGEMDTIIEHTKSVMSYMTGVSKTQRSSLRDLKRGVFFKEDLPAGHVLAEEDVFYAMPVESGGQLTTADIYDWIGGIISSPVKKNQSAFPDHVEYDLGHDQIQTSWVEVSGLLKKAGNIPVKPADIEFSAHYGPDKFSEYGATIINRVNREYCKKLILMHAGQKHPTHKHLRKEEAFELLYGDCTVVLDGKTVELVRGEPVVILKGQNHSFSSQEGCVVEEISTTHFKGDSIYEDPTINKLTVDERKIYFVKK